MDKCSSCLMLKEVRKLKAEVISFSDSDDKPAYCRDCYQTERAKLEKLQEEFEEFKDEVANATWDRERL